jgi:acyl-CoA synthetase
VQHDQARWHHFHGSPSQRRSHRARRVPVRAAAPFGFGIWTGHVTPTLLGAPTVLLPQFDAAS